MPTSLYGRHGDLIWEVTTQKVDTNAARKVRAFVFAGDSSNHPHTLKGSSLVQDLGAGRFRVQVDKPTKLTHGSEGGHKNADIEAQTYEVRPLRERGGNGDVNVTD